MNRYKYDTTEINIKKLPKTIILFINESWASESISMFENNKVSKLNYMPKLSAISKERNAILLKRNFANATSTILSVPSILTGLSVDETAAKFGIMPTFYSAFKQSGYKTAIFSSQYYTFYSISKKYFSDDTDVFLFSDNLNTPQMNDVGIDDYYIYKKVKEFLSEQEKNEHFFLIINPNSLHTPFQTKTNFQNILFDKTKPRYQLSSSILDTFIAEIFIELKNMGRLDDSLIWLTGDHGESFVSRHDRARILNLNDEIILIPSLIFYPKKWENDEKYKNELKTLKYNSENFNTQNLDIVHLHYLIY